ncbi:hypothetical protein OKL56_11840 [Enterococcus hirae]|uniref:hypothetical protein n=1 Tax=Enterococcus hirae TaxID=1354 RepID=UPI00221EF584|nr:hypothetical protein [Enterococcus hirae]MDW3666425.1 hypothetical protein [Enterococcus hirae]UYT92569.1 hypothetical protein OKL56_11840 [Enterococcus hirae]
MNDIIKKDILAYENHIEIEGFSKMVDVDRIKLNNKIVECYSASLQPEVDLYVLNKHNAIILLRITVIDGEFNLPSCNKKLNNEIII